MYMRVSHFTLKPNTQDAATAQIKALKSKIMGLPGVIRFTSSFNPDGTGCSVSINESKEKSDANAAAVQEIWSHFKDYLSGAPVVSGYDVNEDWSV